MGGLRHGERGHWLGVTRQDANLSLTGSRGLLGEVVERNKTISRVQVRGWPSVTLCGIALRHSLNTFRMLGAMLSLTLSDRPTPAGGRAAEAGEVRSPAHRCVAGARVPIVLISRGWRDHTEPAL